MRDIYIINFDVDDILSCVRSPIIQKQFRKVLRLKARKPIDLI